VEDGLRLLLTEGLADCEGLNDANGVGIVVLESVGRVVSVNVGVKVGECFGAVVGEPGSVDAM